MYQTKQQKKGSQIYTKLMNYDAQEKSLSRPADIKSESLLYRMVSKICPCLCLKPSLKNDQNISNSHEETKSNLTHKNKKPNQILDGRKEDLVTVETLAGEGNRRRPLAFTSLHQINAKYEEDNAITLSTLKKWHLYPISSLKEDQLLVVGNQNSKLFAKIKSIVLEPSDEAKNFIKKVKMQQRNSKGESYIDRYWDKRYILFCKFDQGISIQENSWPIIVPESVSQHVASNVKCQTVLNLCCGVGGDAIKLANTCKKVLVWDQNCSNLKCLQINSKVYGADNIEMIAKVENLKSQQIQATVISNLYKLDQQCLKSNQISLKDLQPDLSFILGKALSICPNFVLILPANANINELSQIVVKNIAELDLISVTCCLKIEKIYFHSQLKYLVVYFGGHVSSSIAINDELRWIYTFLGLDQYRSKAEKKLIKNFRQVHGMVKLLNHVLLSSKLTEANPITKFLKHIKENSLLSQQKIVKYLTEKQLEQKETPGKERSQISEQKQRTVSSFSIPSNADRISTDHLQYQNETQEHDPYKSVPMNRESLKPRSLIQSISVHRSKINQFQKDPNIRSSITTSYKQPL